MQTKSVIHCSSGKKMGIIWTHQHLSTIFKNFWVRLERDFDTSSPLNQQLLHLLKDSLKHEQKNCKWRVWTYKTIMFWNPMQDIRIFKIQLTTKISFLKFKILFWLNLCVLITFFNHEHYTGKSQHISQLSSALFKTVNRKIILHSKNWNNCPMKCSDKDYIIFPLD